ncbi:hypothetical protein ACQY0O_000232 [Thecaphora frezii]
MAADSQPPRRSTRSRMSLSGTGSGGLQLGGSSMTTRNSAGTASSSAASFGDAPKENRREDTMSQAKDRLAKKKRAASVGGAELQTLLRESRSQFPPAATSRRNAPGPRKSAIRAVPQIFESPTGLIPSPTSRQGLGLRPSVESPGKAKGDKSAPSFATAAAARDATQTIAAFGVQDATLTLNDAAAGRNCATQVIRPKRRVTFSKRQEKTEFARDEPTLNLGSLRREEPATPSTTQGSSSLARSFNHSDSDSDSDSDPDSDMSFDASAVIAATTSDMMLSGSSYGNASSDMDMSLESPADDSDDDQAGEGEDVTKSMEMTVAHGQIRKRKASNLTNSDTESDTEESLDAMDVDPTMIDMSHAMDFTEAVGSAPLLKRRRSSVAQLAADRAGLMDNEQADDMTASRTGITFTHAASDESSLSPDPEDEDDRSETMDFTTPMGSGKIGCEDDSCRNSTRLSMASAGSDDLSDEEVDRSVSMDVTTPVTTVIRTKASDADAADETEQVAPHAVDADDSEDGGDASADMSLPMDMTRAMTGMIEQKGEAEQDESELSSLSDTDRDDTIEADQDATVQSAMEMTKAIGKITSRASPLERMASPPPRPSLRPSPRKSPRKSPQKQAEPRSPIKVSSESPRKPSVSEISAPATASDMSVGAVSRFRQSLRGGIESPSYVRSPARRVGGNVPPPGRPSLSGVPITNFRQSLIGGVESPGYIRSPARRIQASPLRLSDNAPAASVPLPAVAKSSASKATALTIATPTKPTSSGRLPGLSLSARKRSASPESKTAKRAAMMSARKSLGSHVTSASSLFRPQPITNGKEARQTRSSIVAAVLPEPEPERDDAASTASDPPSDPEEPSFPDVFGDEVDIKAAESSYSLDDGGDAPFNMPLNAFLSHVGVQFHEDMSASRHRPVPPRDADASMDADAAGSKEPVGLIRLVKAACGAVPQLEALRDACREIKEQVDDGRERLLEMEAAFYSNPPDFVREIMGLSNEEEKKEMEAQFKLQKQAARALAVSDYYGWRMDKEFDAEMVQTLQAYHGRLQCDLEIVEEKRERLSKHLLPPLRARHLELEWELNAARRRQMEIEECDQEELKSLYASIEEQHEVLESMRSKLTETEQSHQRVVKRLHENEEKMASATEMIAQAHAVCDQIQGCTRGEAQRLLREIRNLERLHLVRIANVSAATAVATGGAEAGWTRIEVVLDGWLLVGLGLDVQQGGEVKEVTMRSLGKDEGNGPSLVHQLAVKILSAEFEKERPNHAVLILRRISKTLIRHRHLLAEIEHLRCRFPLELIPADTDGEAPAPATAATATKTKTAATVPQELYLRASVLLPRQRSKVVIEARSNLVGSGAGHATFDTDSVKVETVYGPADALAISAQILDCLAADPTIGCLSRACLQTVETFDV